MVLGACGGVVTAVVFVLASVVTVVAGAIAASALDAVYLAVPKFESGPFFVARSAYNSRMFRLGRTGTVAAAALAACAVEESDLA